MNALLRASYAAAGAAARLAVMLAPPDAGSKTWRAIGARRNLLARYRAWSSTGRDSNRPLVWIHAPSVGEGLQARPVIHWLRKQRPDLQIAYTYFSPSAERFGSAMPADFADYLPFDATAEMQQALDALRPSALVYSKLDVWPALTLEASRRGIPTGLISATVAPESSRLGLLPRVLLHDTYASLAAVGAVAPEDATRLCSLGARRQVVRITGDTRYDQVWTRSRAGENPELVAALRSPRPTLVAGSTWPSDDRVLLYAWANLRALRGNARLIIAPHEPKPTHLAPLEQWARERSLSVARIGAPHASQADIVIVDRVGVLGDLYALATVAYVGGGFHGAGLHSVLEPAAFGVPVLFGPRHQNSRDAVLLLDAGGARRTGTVEEIRAALDRWLYNSQARDLAGSKARAMVESGIGATERSGRLIVDLLGR